MQNNIIKLINIFLSWINLLSVQFQKFSQRVKNRYNKEFPETNEELTKYINKIFEQQEKERIVRWLINSIRESLDLNEVLSTIVEEIGRLLKVDRCLIALFEKEEQKFYFRSEYKNDEDIASLIVDEKQLCEIPYKWQTLLVNYFEPIIINNCKQDKLASDNIKYFEDNDIKSLIIIPVAHKGELLGIIIAHQVEYPRKWEDAHSELLKDIGSQIAVAIVQAILYSKIQEATRLKSEFLAGMSHELRTPLNAVLGFSEMLLSENFGKLNEKQKKFLNNISISGEHLLRLVNDILDLSKIESGNMEINREIFNAHLAIKETISVLTGVAMKKKICIKMDVNLDIYLNADLRRFKQIMYNLLSNAIKFTKEEDEIAVRVFQDEENIRVEVYDNGIGISPKDRDKIFKSFSQLDSSLTRRQEGTGLGLTLTKKFIELHKGKIDFESEENKGSKFWFTLPMIKSDEMAKV